MILSADFPKSGRKQSPMFSNLFLLSVLGKIQDYKEANRDFISQNRNKTSNDILELEDIIAEEKRQEAKRKQEDALFEKETKSAKVRDKEKLIDELMFSDKDSKDILEEHQKSTATHASSVAEFLASKNDYKQQAKKVHIEAKPFIYEEIVMSFEGPEPPANEVEVVNQQFNRHIRAAEVHEKAAGYQESIGALRALQEAMSGLYFDQF